MPTRSARTAWPGGLQDGSGQVELTNSGAGTFEVNFPQRAADDAAFKDAADKARAGCPISKALTGVEITLDAALES